MDVHRLYRNGNTLTFGRKCDTIIFLSDLEVMYRYSWVIWQQVGKVAQSEPKTNSIEKQT